MSYRGYDNARGIAAQMALVRQVAGVALTWREWVSASALGNAYEGYGERDYFADHIVTGFIGKTIPTDVQQDVGQIARQQVKLVTDFPLGGVRDKVLWGERVYRVESESVQSPLSLQWSTQLVLGDASGY